MRALWMSGGLCAAMALAACSSKKDGGSTTTPPTTDKTAAAAETATNKQAVEAAKTNTPARAVPPPAAADLPEGFEFPGAPKGFKPPPGAPGPDFNKKIGLPGGNKAGLLDADGNPKTAAQPVTANRRSGSGLTPTKVETRDQTIGRLRELKTKLDALLPPGAEHAALTLEMRPEAGDYGSIFIGAMAGRAMKIYDAAWDKGDIVIKPPNARRRQIQFWTVTTEQLRNRDTGSEHFRPSWRNVLDHLQPGVEFTLAKYVMPGMDRGDVYAAFAWLNGRWIFLPEPGEWLKDEL